MLTTAGSTLAATPASDRGSAETFAEIGATVRPASWARPLLLPPSSAAPTPTPAPPNTSAASPAATAVVRHGARARTGPECGGAAVVPQPDEPGSGIVSPGPPSAWLRSSPPGVGQNRSSLI